MSKLLMRNKIARLKPGSWIRSDEKDPPRSKAYRVRGLDGKNAGWRVFDWKTKTWGALANNFMDARRFWQKQQAGSMRKSPRLQPFQWYEQDESVLAEVKASFSGPDQTIQQKYIRLLEDVHRKAARLCTLLPVEGSQSHAAYHAKTELDELRASFVTLDKEGPL